MLLHYNHNYCIHAVMKNIFATHHSIPLRFSVRPTKWGSSAYCFQFSNHVLGIFVVPNYHYYLMNDYRYKHGPQDCKM